MSTISEIYDALHSMISSTLSTHKKLFDPYQLEENPEHALTQGYGLAIGGAQNNEDLLSGQISLSRDMSVILTRRLSAYQTDAAQKGVAEKQLLEDLRLIIRATEMNPSLNGFIANSSLVSTTFIGDEGISQIAETSFIQLIANFRIKYFEQLGG